MINPVKRGVSKARKACHSLVLSTSHQNPAMKLRTLLVKPSIGSMDAVKQLIDSGERKKKCEWESEQREF